MFSFYEIKKHHIGIALIVALIGMSVYQSIEPLPEARADTVNILIDTEGTGGEIPCSTPTIDDGNCSLGGIFGPSGYLKSYLVGSGNTNKQFRITVADHVNRIRVDELVNIRFPAACTNCSIDINGAHTNGAETAIVPVIKLDSGIKPPTPVTIDENNNPITLKNFHFLDAAETAILIRNVSQTTITLDNNTFGAKDTSSQANNHGLIIENSSNTVINENTFGGHGSDAVILRGSGTQNTRFSNNIFGVTSRTSLNTILPAIEGSALAITDEATTTQIDGNNIFANGGEHGIRIVDSHRNTIDRGNIFFNNAGKAIELINAANNNIASAQLSSAEKNSSNITIRGTGASNATINFYRVNNSATPSVVPDNSGGEGFAFLGSATIDGFEDRNPSSSQFQFTFPATISIGDTISSFQTTSQNSSVFSNNVIVTQAVTPPTPSSSPTATPTSPAPTPTPTPTPQPSPSPSPLPGINQRPLANAGSDQVTTPNTNVQLNGSASSDPDGDTLSFLWTQRTSDRYQVSLNNRASANPSFTSPISVAELRSELHFTLTVSDSRGGTSSDDVTIILNRSRIGPTANLLILPSIRVVPGTEIILDGSDSRFDTGILTREFRFRQIPSANNEITVSIDQTTPRDSQARVTIPAGLRNSTNFTFELTVFDGVETSAPVNQVITAAPQATSTQICTDAPPQADAGRNQTINRPVGTIVALDGMRSTDPNNTALSFSWRQLSGGIRVDLRNASSPVANFTIPQLTTSEATFTFELTVTNRCNNTDTSTTRVLVRNDDVDNDGLNTAREAELGTDANNADTDTDGILDGREVNSGCLSPLNRDTDNDGLSDGEEDINRNAISDNGETNPCIADTESDTMPDGFERNAQLNPLDPRDANEDADTDGLTNKEEFAFRTNPQIADSDHDGITDGSEVRGSNKTSPIDDDTDDDGLLDGNEDNNKNGSTEANETYPNRFDSDFDGLSDGLELGLGSPQGKNTDNKKFQPDLDPLSKTSPLTPDTDGDRITDGKEDSNKNGSFDCNETDPLNTDNKVKSCEPAKPSPTPVANVNKSARSTTPGISIQVNRAPATNASSGLVRLISPLSNFSISVQGQETTGISKSARTPANTTNFSLTPPPSILVAPGIIPLPATGMSLSSILVLDQLTR